MPEIVGGFGVPHNPHLPGWVADGAPAAGEIARMYGGVAERLRRVRPNVLLFFTGDHYNIFFEACVPIFGIGVAESANGASDDPELRRRHVPIAPDLARHGHVETVRAGFDVGMSQEFDFDHTVMAPLHFLVPDASIPVVRVFVNALIPPLPSSTADLRRAHPRRLALRLERTAQAGLDETRQDRVLELLQDLVEVGPGQREAVDAGGVEVEDGLADPVRGPHERQRPESGDHALDDAPHLERLPVGGLGVRHVDADDVARAGEVGAPAVDRVEALLGGRVGLVADDVAAAEHADLAAGLARQGLDLGDLLRGGLEAGEPGER
jgi:catalytic LigB subunit of aromatic ring-opening dioxygenase